MGKVRQEAGESKAPSYPHKSGPSIALLQEGAPQPPWNYSKAGLLHTQPRASLAPPSIQPFFGMGDRGRGLQYKSGPPVRVLGLNGLSSLLNLVLHLCKRRH